MTGAQQHAQLYDYVKRTAKYLKWPHVERPFTGDAVSGESKWREMLNILARVKSVDAVGALDYLADQLHEFQKGEDRWQPPQTNSAEFVQVTTRALRVTDSAHSDPDGSLPASSLPALAPDFVTFCRALSCAQAHGLRVHPFKVNWFDATEEGDELGGYALRNTVWLQRGLSDDELFRTVVHELKHVHDWLTLGPKYFDLPQAERERRAWAFEASVMLAEGRPSPWL